MQIKRNIWRAMAVSATVAGLGMGMAVPANAFSSSSSINVSGVTYTANAWSCNVYVRSCDWDAEATTSATKKFTHRGDVKANGISVSVTISAGPSATISGNSTSLATASRTVTAKRNYMSGTAKPSIFSVSVASRSRLTSGSVTANSGWTTW